MGIFNSNNPNLGNVNQEELSKVIRGMQPDFKNSPNFNQEAANIVQRGVSEKNAFRAENNPFKPKSKLL